MSMMRKSFGRKVESFALDEKLQYVEGLSDVQLRKELKYLGETIGPVTGSTRSIYQKKLATLMLTPKKMVEEDNEEEEEEEEMEVEEPAEQEEEEEEQYSDSEPEIKPTPSARGDAVMSRLRPRSTVTTQTEVRRVTRQSQSNAVQRTQQTKAKKTQRKRLIPIWVQILLFLLLAAFIFLVWYNMETVPALPFYSTPEIDSEKTGSKQQSDTSPV